MADRSPSLRFGYLRLDGKGGCSARAMAEFLQQIDATYQAVARVELTAYAALTWAEEMRQYGPRRFFLTPWAFQAPLSDSAVPAERLVVHRVVLESPGVWEFLGTLNPLEVIRKYLVDRHERRKDREYREDAERQQLALENALRALRVYRELEELERDFGPNAVPVEVRQRIVAAEVREPLERLADFDTRGLIDGGSAAIKPDA